jgi:molybdate/tungstate transport system substrate-binding protein
MWSRSKCSEPFTEDLPSQLAPTGGQAARGLALLLVIGLLVGGCAAGQGTALPAHPTQPAAQVTEPQAAASQAAAALPTLAASSTPPRQRTPLVVFCAGSLILPFADLEKAFEAQHPEIDVLNECHGSIQVIRHVTELHESIDVVATADHALIPMLMYSTNDPESGLPYGSWYIRFASNRLALAYSPTSRFADEIGPDNWYQVIERPGVKLGLADPRFDAIGYRALMALKLAEKHHNRRGLFDSLIKGRFRYPITAFEEDLVEITVPEIVEPLPDSGIVLRGASIQLIALLESGDLDYAFEYESVIRQHGLKWVALPEAVNLGSAAYNEQYAWVQVKLDFQRFATVKPVFRGEQIGYGISIPSNAPHPEAAAQFIAFLLGAQGRQVMERDAHPVADSLQCDGVENMPADLRLLCPNPPP